MLKNIRQILIKNKYLLLLLSAVIAYLSLTIPAILDKDHVMKNLEPYPDGILFSLSARNLSLGKELKLVTSYGQVPFWVPPLYSLYLSGFYLLSSSVNIFYLANVILGILTITTLYLIIKKSSSGIWPLIAGFSIYFSHIIIFWLPSLAMSENLSLFLFALLFLGLIETRLKLKLILIIVASLGLMLSRFSTAPILIAALPLAICQEKRFFFKYLWQFFTIFLLVLALLLYLLQIAELEIIRSNILASILNSSFFNFSFVINNLQKYLIALTFSKGNFLWLNLGISSWPIFGLFLFTLYKMFKAKQYSKFFILIILFGSLFPLQLLFYTADARYLIYLIFIFAVAGTYLLEITKNKQLILGLIFLAVIINVFYQKEFLKQLIADNILGRSTAWQHEAILHFDKNLNSEQMIITALPPFLVDAYQSQKYRPLPLSKDQEFLQKKIYVWGDDINYDDLFSGYKEMLKQGKKIYISNAYITHQSSVITDYEKYQEEFKLELVAEGCQQSCNIYKLELK